MSSSSGPVLRAPKRHEASSELREPTFTEFAECVNELMARSGYHTPSASDESNEDSIVDACSRMDEWSDRFSDSALTNMGFEDVGNPKFVYYKNAHGNETGESTDPNAYIAYCRLPSVLSNENMSKEYCLMVRVVSSENKKNVKFYAIPATLKRLASNRSDRAWEKHLRKVIHESLGNEQLKTEYKKYQKIMDIDPEIKAEYENENEDSNGNVIKGVNVLENPVLLTMFEIEFDRNYSMCAAYAATMIRGFTHRFDPHSKGQSQSYVWLCEKRPDGTYHAMERRAMIRMYTRERELYTVFDTPIPMMLSTRANVAAWATNVAVIAVGRTKKIESRDSSVRYVDRMRYAGFRVLLEMYNNLNDSFDLGHILMGKMGFTVADAVNGGVSAAEYICFNLRSGTALLRGFEMNPKYNKTSEKRYNMEAMRDRLGVLCRYMLGYSALTCSKSLFALSEIKNGKLVIEFGSEKSGTKIPYIFAYLFNGAEKKRVTIGYVKSEYNALDVNNTHKNEVVTHYNGILERLQEYKKNTSFGFSKLINMLLSQDNEAKITNIQLVLSKYVVPYLDRHDELKSTNVQTTEAVTASQTSASAYGTPSYPYNEGDTFIDVFNDHLYGLSPQSTLGDDSNSHIEHSMIERYPSSSSPHSESQSIGNPSSSPLTTNDLHTAPSKLTDDDMDALANAARRDTPSMIDNDKDEDPFAHLSALR